MANSIAETILAQLGGRKFIVMTGARDFVGSPDALSFKLPRPSPFNAVRITLTSLDLYTVTFYKGKMFKPVKEVAGVYADQLRSVFTSATGLETSLGTMRNPGAEVPHHPDRDDTIKRIRDGLKRRSGHVWSVKGGRGTAWGWISVTTPPAQQLKHGRHGMSRGETIALRRLLGYADDDATIVGSGGWSIPGSSAYYRDAIKRAETGASDENPKPYWD